MTKMEHINSDTLTGFFFGMFGGFIKFVSGSLLDVTFGMRLFEAGTTALICGFLGVGGKHLFNYVHRKIFKKQK